MPVWSARSIFGVEGDFQFAAFSSRLSVLGFWSFGFQSSVFSFQFSVFGFWFLGAEVIHGAAVMFSVVGARYRSERGPTARLFRLHISPR